MQPDQSAACSAVPRDCVVVFLMPELSPLAMAHGNSANGPLVSGILYRTEPQGFPEASKRAAHYARVTVASVVSVTPHVLDSYPEIPIPKALAQLLYKQRTPRFRNVESLLRPVEIPGLHPWRN